MTEIKERVSVITPAFNEETNLPLLFERLMDNLTPLGVDWEWIVVDDHSADQTWKVLLDLATKNTHVKAVRLARNSGSHAAFSCGLLHASGDCAVVLAADLQDPPETIVELIQKWKQGAKIVWAVRADREGERLSTLFFSRAYYWILRNFVGIKDTPPMGADFFLIDRRVIDVLKVFKETNVSLLALLTWMGFKQDQVPYVKRARLSGKSGWSLEKKLKLVVDSITSFTYKPIRWMSGVGVVTALLGFAYAGFLLLNRFLGRPPEGWTALIVAVLVIGGLQMIMMGVLGEYVWRALDEARNRPRFIVEDEAGFYQKTNGGSDGRQQ